MSNVDKRALREAAEKAISEEGETWWSEEQLASDYGLALHKADAKFIAAANPATVLALLDELEAAENRINRLEAIVAVAEQRNALMREWKRALKVPCDLVDDQVPVVIHGMVIRLERLKETEAKLEAVEKRNERALSLLKDASPENVWDVIGRLKVVIGGDYRSESEIAAAAGKGE